MEKMNDLKDLLKHEIEDLYSVEEQILEALPKMIEKASNADLKRALKDHLKITEQHKSRLDKIQKSLMEGEEGKKKGFLSGLFGGKHTCKGMQGIIEERNKIMNADISPEALDAAIIASAQKVEHYEICGYGTAKSFAWELGMEQLVKQLEQTLNEEYEADVLLTQLAEARVNLEAEKGEGSSASSRGRSAGRSKEKTGKAMEMEAVKTGRSESSVRENGSSSKSSSQRGNVKPADASRNENAERNRTSSKKTAGVQKASSKSSGSSGRSSSGGRSSSTSSRGRK